MTIFIARDGVEIGECPREEVADLLRKGEILETDHYWHEGMEAWGRIDDLLGIRTVRRYGEPYAPPIIAPPEPAEDLGPPPPRKNWRLIGAIAAGGTLAVVGLGALLIKPDGPSSSEARSLTGAAPSPQLSAEQVREEAVADLKARIHRLPARATPPLNTVYYDVSVNMKKMVTSRTPWIAIIRGRENTINPETLETLSQTEFTLNAEYTDGEWVYRSYSGSVTNVAESTTTEIRHDDVTRTTPSIVGMLGLKLVEPPKTSISIAQ